MIKLTSETYFIELQEETVFMSLQNNDYYSLDTYGTQIWNCIRSSPKKELAVEKVSSILSISESESIEVVDELIEYLRGLNLIEFSSEGIVDVPSPKYSAPATVPLEHYEIEAAHVSFVQLLRTFQLFLWYKRTLKTGKINKALSSLFKKAPCWTDHLLPDSLESRKEMYVTRKSVGIVRSFFSRGEPDCLPKSFTVAHLLRKKGISAEICIGIQKVPFEAHAWVEVGGIVASTSDIDRLKNYQVIARL